MAKISINLGTGSLQQDEMIVGIDLGTTNSLVAVVHPTTKAAIVLRDVDQQAIVPSLVHFDTTGQIHIGLEAKPFLSNDASRTIYSVKRLIGKSYADVQVLNDNYGYKIINNNEDGLVKIEVDGQFYSPVELSSYVLRNLKERAEHVLKTPVHKAVITVPAYFNDAQRQATRDAGKLAGLDVLRIINEPTAASLAYGQLLAQKNARNIAVYDFGGGTFDISILTLDDGIYDVLSSNGDTHLGGDDIDNAIVDFFCTTINCNDAEEKIQLRLIAEEAKQYLSEHTQFSKVYKEHTLQLSRAELVSMAAPILHRTMACCQRALDDSGLGKNDIQEVILVGGSTRMPLVKEMVAQFFETTIIDSINPDEVVALGAAWQANVLAGNQKDILLLDVTPLSLGIETMGGLMDVIIPRNSKIPSGAARQYTTHVDGQSKMSITVYQGERDLVKDNRLLSQFVLNGIPGMPAGLPKIEIAFKVNTDGILKVSAKELRSGVQQEITIAPQQDLTDSKVEEMLLDSLQHAKADIAERALVEARTEAEQLLHATRTFLQKHSIATEQEINDTNTAMAALEAAMQGQEKNLIHQAIERLNNISRPYAERLMDNAVQSALSGKSIS